MAAQPSPPQFAHRHEAANQPPSGNNSDDDDFSWIAPKDMATLKEMSSEPGLVAHENLYRENIKTLPKGTKLVRFVGEGAANAVFEFKVPEASRLGADFKGLLLRVAKVSSLGQPLTYDYMLQQRFYHSVIKPVLNDHTVHQELVILRKSSIISECNKLLQSINHQRKEKFRGSFVGQSDWGLLLEDMRPEDPEECVLIEFKPKWLCQSPSAPKHAIRCRQCAMEFQNFIRDPAPNKGLPEDKPCPLALGSKAPSQVSSPFRIAPQLAHEANSREHFIEVLRNTANHKAITDLRAQQIILDRDGPLNATQSDLRFVLAMTLRDCTCFVQISRRPGSNEPLRLRLGDFDWKDPKVKFERWRSAEEDLVKGGFYTAEWILCGQTYYHPPTLCALEWTSRKRTDKPEIVHLQDVRGSRKPSKQHETALSQLQAESKVRNHKVDLGVLEPLLQRFKKESQTSSNSWNPFRSDPRPMN